MRKETEHIRNKIKENGYLSATKITLLLKDYNPSLEESELKQILKEMMGDGVHKIEYTNRYVAPYTTKDLYIYNPNHTEQKKQTKRTYKKSKKKR